MMIFYIRVLIETLVVLYCCTDGYILYVFKLLPFVIVRCSLYSLSQSKHGKSNSIQYINKNFI